MDLALKGKVAVITGGSVGIGLAIAEGLAAEGVNLVLAARLRIRAMPRHAHATLSIVTTGHSRSQNGVLRTPMPVVHAEFEQANARWKALCKRSFGMARTNGKERKRFGGETPTDARLFYRAARARPRLDRQAHIYRRSTAVLVPRSLSSQGTQHQAFTSWDVAARVGLSVERALPAPTCPSPANKRAPVVVPRG